MELRGNVDTDLYNKYKQIALKNLSLLEAIE